MISQFPRRDTYCLSSAITSRCDANVTQTNEINQTSADSSKTGSSAMISATIGEIFTF